MNYLMWVSGLTKISDFIEEALHLGISRRLPFLPRQLNKGSRIYLASLQIKHVRGIDGKVKHETSPVIFGEFMVDHIEFIVDEINPIIDEKFTKKGLAFCQIIKKQERMKPKRMDGKRLTSGTIYAVNYPPDIDSYIKERKGLFIVYEPYIQAKIGLKFFRGIKNFELKDYIKWLITKKNEINN